MVYHVRHDTSREIETEGGLVTKDTPSPKAKKGASEVVKWTAWIVVVAVSTSFGAQGCSSSDSETNSASDQSADVKELIKGLEFNPGRDGMDPRPFAAERLGKMGPAAQEAVPALKKLLRDKKPEVRDAAQQALAKIEGK